MATGDDAGRPLEPSVGGHGPLDTAIALFVAMRPRQWPKNLFVFVALVFTDRWNYLGVTCLAFALFCVVSGSIYLLNDVVDREQDREHPEKRNRPIASGRLSLRAAVAASILFGWGGVGASFLLNPRFGLVALTYYGLQVLYSYWLKHVVLIDVFAIAAGFVLRAVAGGFAIEVPNSVWLLVCTLQLALFLGFGKRRQEILALQERAGNHRRILSQYSVPFLDQMISIVLSGLVVSYALYVINSPTALAHPGLVMTLPNVMYGIFRYLYLIHIEHKGGSPEAILLEDRPMQVSLLLWIVEVIASFKYPGTVHGASTFSR